MRGENAADREIRNQGETVDLSGAFVKVVEGKKLPAIEVFELRAGGLMLLDYVSV